MTPEQMKIIFEEWLDEIWPLWKTPQNRYSVHYYDLRKAFYAGYNIASNKGDRITCGCPPPYNRNYQCIGEC